MNLTKPKMSLKEAVEYSGIKPTEFGELCDGVTRVTVYKWMSGSPVHKLRQAKVNKLVRALESAIAAKDMPIVRPKTRKVDHELVMSQIKKIIIKHVSLVLKTG